MFEIKFQTLWWLGSACKDSTTNDLELSSPNLSHLGLMMFLSLLLVTGHLTGSCLGKVK